MTLRDWATLLVSVGGLFGWFYSWWRNRELKIQMRGVQGWKFRAMWREYANKHDILINGDDSE